MNLPTMTALWMELKKINILGNLFKTPQFNDEPHFPQWVCENLAYPSDHENNGVSIDYSDSNAKCKAIAESIERFCLMKPEKEKVICDCYINLKENALDPADLYFSTKNSKANANISRRIREANITWVRGERFATGETILIPSQLVYSRFISKEPMIQIPISTGAAFGLDEESTKRRGLLEVVERDSFMKSWLSKTGFTKVTSKETELQEIFNYFSRYFIEPYIFRIDSNFGVNVFMALLIDRSGIGPAVSCGLGAGNNSKRKRALLEAQQVRSWIRFCYLEKGNKIERKEQITDFKTRGLYWYPKKRVEDLSFLIEAKDVSSPSINPQRTRESSLAKSLVDSGNEVYFVDLVPETLKRYGFYVIKSIVPSLFPLRINEQKSYNPKAMKDKKYQLNQIPHPFL